MADYQYIDETGVIVPDTQTLKTNVQSEFTTAFGSDLVLSDNTPQGVLIVSETLARANVLSNNAALANQINPNIAGGVFLDAILALTGSKRTPNTYTIVSAKLSGVVGTVIPAGVTAQTTAGDVFASVAAVTLDSTGNAIVNFQAQQPGSILAPANTLTTIISGILGWESIINPADATTLGALQQSDESARIFRQNTLAIQGDALPVAITSGLYATAGVLSLSFRENLSWLSAVIDGVTMSPKSIYACVDGGTDLDVATTLLAKKSGGCGYSNGAGIPVTVNVLESASGQTYPVSFDRPTPISILVQVTVVANATITNPVTTVQQVVYAYSQSNFKVGTPVSCFELAGAITAAIPGIYIQNLQTKLAAGSFSTNEIPISIFQKAFIPSESSTVVIVNP